MSSAYNPSPQHPTPCAYHLPPTALLRTLQQTSKHRLSLPPFPSLCLARSPMLPPAFTPSLPLRRHALPSRQLSSNHSTRPPLHLPRRRPASPPVPTATASQPLSPRAPPPPPPRTILTPATARPALFVVAFLYGSLTVVMRVLARPSSVPFLAAHPTINPLVYNILRLAVSSILSIIVLLRSARPSQTLPSPSAPPTFSRLRLLLAGLELGAWNAAINVAVVAAVASVPAPRVAFLVQTQTILVPLAALALALLPPRDRPALASAPRVLALAAFALAGSALLSFDGAAVAAALSPGDAAALCAALCASLYVLRSQAFIRTSFPPSLLTAVKNIAQALIATAHLALTAPEALALPSLGPAALAINAALVVYGGVCVNFIGAGVQMASLEHVPASDAALIFAFAPVVTAAIAAAVMGEVLGLAGLVGAAMILAASIATVLLGARKKSA